jgi:hypothetical protein
MQHLGGCCTGCKGVAKVLQRCCKGAVSKGITRVLQRGGASKDVASKRLQTAARNDQRASHSIGRASYSTSLRALKESSSVPLLLALARPWIASYLVLQWCYSGVTVVLQWCNGGVTVVLKWCYSGVKGKREMSMLCDIVLVLCDALSVLCNAVPVLCDVVLVLCDALSVLCDAMRKVLHDAPQCGVMIS